MRPSGEVQTCYICCRFFFSVCFTLPHWDKYDLYQQTICLRVDQIYPVHLIMRWMVSWSWLVRQRSKIMYCHVSSFSGKITAYRFILPVKGNDTKRVCVLLFCVSGKHLLLTYCAYVLNLIIQTQLRILTHFIFLSRFRSLSSHLIYPLTARVVGAPQMISQPVSSIFFPVLHCHHLANSRPVHSPMLSSHHFLCLPCLLPLFIVPCKMVLARPVDRTDLMNVRHDHTTAVCVSLPWSGGLRVVRLPAGSWHGLLRW